VFQVVDRDATEIRRQSEWFDGMDLADTIRLAERATLAQITTRDDFRKRMDASGAIGLHELLYPLLQGYDSVAVGADVELGGTDQLFNLLFARDIQRESGMKPQDVMTMPLLEGLDGVQKMSKSLGNYIGVADRPADMFGKVMSVPDGLIGRYFLLAVGVGEDELGEIERRLSGGENPRDLKAELARAIVTRFHSARDATAAEDAFTAQYRRGEQPEEMEERSLGKDAATVVEALVGLGLSTSKGEARRLVAQRGVRLNGVTLEDPESAYEARDGDVWQVGKHRYVRLRAAGPNLTA
jgi:tyrosyl-tRNA synthetase